MILALLNNSYAGMPKPTNSLSFLFGGEQNFRGTDHASYLTYGFELNNIFSITSEAYLEIDNQFSFGPGFYYITNPYSKPGSYPSNLNKYYGRATLGRTFTFSNNYKLALGIGGGYRRLYYQAKYNKSFVEVSPSEFPGVFPRAIFLYEEAYIPLQFNLNIPFEEKISLSFNNIVIIGPHGLAQHTFTGPNGFTEPTYHRSIGYYPTILLNYNNLSLGPWGSFDWLTLGEYHHMHRVPAGNQLKIIEFGIKTSYVF